jgi:hypothetical protein
MHGEYKVKFIPLLMFKTDCYKVWNKCYATGGYANMKTADLLEPKITK